MNSVVVNGILSGLKEGNKAFVNGQAVNFEKIHKQRMETAVKGQNPEVVVIACSDSRVPPELIFSAGIGEIPARETTQEHNLWQRAILC